MNPLQGLVYIILFFGCMSAGLRRFPGASVVLLRLKLYEVSSRRPQGKLAKKGEGRTADAGAAPSDQVEIVQRELNIQDLKQFQAQLEPYNGLAAYLIIAGAQFLAGEAIARATGRDRSPFLFLTALAAACSALYHALTATWRPVQTSGRVRKQDANALLTLTAVLPLFVAVLLLLLPPTLLDTTSMALADDGVSAALQFWQRGAELDESQMVGGQGLELPPTLSGAEVLAAEEFGLLGKDKVQGAGGTAAGGGRVRVASLALLSSVAGATAGLLLLPTMRFARSMGQVLQPSGLAQAALHTSSAASTLLPSRAACATVFMAVATPAASLLLWVLPVAEDLLGLGPRARRSAQALGAMASGVALLLATRPLLQAYLNTAFLRWYWHTHNALRPGGVARDLPAAVSVHAVYTLALLPQAAMDVLAPAVLNIVLGMLLLAASEAAAVAPREVADGPEAEAAAGGLLLLRYVTPPPALQAPAAAAAAGASLFICTGVCMGTLLLHRHGLVGSTY